MALAVCNGCEKLHDTLTIRAKWSFLLFDLVSSILKAHSLFGHIDDTLPCPPKHLPSSTLGTNSEINPEYLQWLSRDQALITLINATLSSSALAHVVSSVSSKALWLSLEKRYSSNTRSNILDLRSALYTIKKTLLKALINTPLALKPLSISLMPPLSLLKMKKSLFTLSMAFPLPSTHFVPLFELATATSPLKNFTPFSFRKKQSWPKLQPLKPFQQPWRRFTHLSIMVAADEDAVSTPLMFTSGRKLKFINSG
uniref:Retrovirus-related Pol polyprotein from transposon TNT 1-94 n=1 Tax=Cucumis melo TaxID=3656 RepID=A0A9I9E501_CUCME